MSDPSRLDRAQRSLLGVSVGDAFGERFFYDTLLALERIAARATPSERPWRWTDDTAMAKSVVANLEAHGAIEVDSLAAAMLEEYRREPWRGYGGGAHRLFERITAGVPWREAAGSLFEGTGSYGNGAAMRVAPVGAYFAEDLDEVVEQARRSAVVTHAHPEGQAGAIAIAVAAAVAWQERQQPVDKVDARVFDEVLARTPESHTRDGIVKARNTPRSHHIDTAVMRLGNGREISSQDTVPLCMWCIARHSDDFQAAMWTTVAALGDRDTTCAIVGGVVALSAPSSTLPPEWIDAREPMEGIPLSDEVPVGNG